MKRFSIVHDMDEKTCLVCGSTLNTHIHEVFFGANRQKSIKYGCCVRLCLRHHNGSNEGVHYNKTLDNKIKQHTQKKFEEVYPHLDFLKIFGRNYL